MTCLHLLVVSILVLHPLAAHVAAPDPVWYEGFFDGADHDDDIAFVRSLTGILASFLYEHQEGRPIPTLLLHVDSPLSECSHLCREGRAPPTL